LCANFDYGNCLCRTSLRQFGLKLPRGIILGGIVSHNGTSVHFANLECAAASKHQRLDLCSAINLRQRSTSCYNFACFLDSLSFLSCLAYSLFFDLWFLNLADGFSDSVPVIIVPVNNDFACRHSANLR